MAVERTDNMTSSSGRSSGQHWAVGANVGVTIALAIILAVAVQYLGYRWSSRVDLTSSGVNSLTDATKSVLHGLETPVKLTSLYFKTDIEAEDQNKYRTAIHDLVGLYRSTNRAKITVEEINPLQDQDQRKQLFKNLLALPKFKEEAAGHVELIENFRNDTLPALGELLSSELGRLEAFSTLEGEDARLVGQVRQVYGQLQQNLKDAAQDIADAMASEVPLYSGAVSSIRQTDAAVQRMLNEVTKVGDQLGTGQGDFSPAVTAFFTEAKSRYGSLLDTLTGQQAKADALPELSFDEIVRDLRSDTGNALLVTTDKDATVVPFRAVWPLTDPRMPDGGFANRKFQGEQKLTSAILQLSQTEKPAVILVRHGGPPLISGGFMPNQPQPTYAKMKANLEDAGFSVHEWDLATQDTPPEIDPAPSRKIWVVLRPIPSPPNMMGQPPQTPPFTPQKLATLKSAMGDDPRALFIAGFMPMMGAMPAPYEYADYLRETWGIDAPCDRVLLYAEQFAQDKYRFVRNPLEVVDCHFADRPMTAELGKMQFTFPMASPITLAAEPPDGVTTQRLMWAPPDDGQWSVSDLTTYVKQQTNEYIVRDPDDHPGEFLLAASATTGKGENNDENDNEVKDGNKGKIVVISSSDFASDVVALQPTMALTSQGLTLRPKNPGNAAFFINALHWLNDNMQWMNLGTPIDTSTLKVERGSGAMKFVWVLCLGILPILAACGGVCMWIVRRR